METQIFEKYCFFVSALQLLSEVFEHNCVGHKGVMCQAEMALFDMNVHILGSVLEVSHYTRNTFHIIGGHLV